MSTAIYTSSNALCSNAQPGGLVDSSGGLVVRASDYSLGSIPGSHYFVYVTVFVCLHVGTCNTQLGTEYSYRVYTVH